MREFTFVGIFTVTAEDEMEARRKLNKCFPTSKKRLDENKARYVIELNKIEEQEEKPPQSKP